jgi:hypothetical protein
MSALEQTPIPGNNERRDAPRLRVHSGIPVFIGRGEGLLVDLSARGARVRHSAQARRSSNVRLTFQWMGERFAATAEVLSSHVAILGYQNVPTIYESRLRFRLLTEESAALLTRVLSSMETDNVRTWVANLRGDSANVQPIRPARATGCYLRCRLIGRRWERKWTHDWTPPTDGFLLPEAADPKEVDDLCTTYLNEDEEGRRLIRLMAAAAILT